jgi:hypothetical protein
MEHVTCGESCTFWNPGPAVQQTMLRLACSPESVGLIGLSLILGGLPGTISVQNTVHALSML